MTPAEAHRELGRLLQGQPEPFPYDRAALLIAVEAYPSVQLASYEERLDAYAARVSQLAGGEDDPRRRLAALRRVLFEEEGFHGNREAYYDVRNSYLNEVLDRRLGIPISLATVLLGVARRIGWPLHPVNFPQHFLLRYSGPEPLAVDAFHGGLILGEEELRERWLLSVGAEPPPPEQMLEPAEPGAVLLRMLNNLRMVYLNEGEVARAAASTEWMALCAPGQPEFLRDAGYLHLRSGDGVAAARCLSRYLGERPSAMDSEVVRDQLARVREFYPDL